MPFRAFRSPEGQQRRPLVLIDDSLDDLLVLSFVLSRAGIERPVLHFQESEKAVDYLEKISIEDPSRRPLLILSDIRMPGLNGIEMISWIRKQPALREIPVVILTVSDHEEDKQVAKSLGVAGFWTKFPAPEVVGDFVSRLEEREAL